jgi:hypothetical protein
MPIVRFPRLTPRGVLSFVMGIAAIFDLTGATVYRTMREVLPPAPPQEDGADPFRAAMRTIMTSYHDAMVAADDRATSRAAHEAEAPVPGGVAAGGVVAGAGGMAGGGVTGGGVTGVGGGGVGGGGAVAGEHERAAVLAA